MNVTKHQQALFNDAYALTHMAADKLSGIYDAELQREKVVSALTDLRNATAALQTLERLLAGQPEPQRGDK
jgi:hypothetical protein